MGARAFLLTVTVMVPACGAADGGPGIPDAGVGDCGLVVTLETRTDDGGYAVVGSGSEAELLVGFQGWNLLYVRGVSPALPPNDSGSILIELDGEPVRGEPFVDLGFHAFPGGYITFPLRVVFNDYDIATLDGRHCRLTMVVGDATCGATAGGDVTLRYNPDCYEAAGGARVCVDAGPP